MTERVTYYSNIDGSIWLYLPRIEFILRNFDIASTPTSIVDAVELYHVSLFFKNKHYAETWSDETIVDFERKANSIDGVIYRYCQGLQPCKIKDLYFHLDYTYQETFWEIINKYKLWGLITNDVLKDILVTEESVIHKILHYGTLVIQYESVIVQYFNSHPKTAEILLSTYIELDRFNNRKEIYIPKSLTISDREQIINQYIESANPNPNYLNLISRKDKENLSISPKIRIKAEGGEKIDEVIVSYGSDATTVAPDVSSLTPSDKRFGGWSQVITNVQGNMTVWPIWKDKIYTVQFIDPLDNNAIIDEYENVPYGGKVAPPTAPVHEGYLFTGWSSDAYLNVTDDLVISAVYEKQTGLNNIEVEQTATKFIHNGQLFIQRGDELFNAQGTRVK